MIEECVECGCTDDEPCIDDWGQPCSWVAPGMCSSCASEIEDAADGETVPRDPDGFAFDREKGLYLR